MESPLWSSSSSYFIGDVASVEEGQKYNYKCLNDPFCPNDGSKPPNSNHWVRVEMCGAALMRLSLSIGLYTFSTSK